MAVTVSSRDRMTKTYLDGKFAAILAEAAAASAAAIAAISPDRCIAYHNTTQSVGTDSVYRALAMNSEDVDTNAMHHLVTNNSRVAAVVAGFYLVLWATGTISAANTGAQLRKGGSTVLQGGDNSSGGVWAGVMSAGEYFEIYGYATQTTNWGSATRASATSLTAIRFAS